MKPNTLAFPLSQTPNVNFLEVAAGLRQMYGYETIYNYCINSKFRTTVGLKQWLNSWIEEESKDLPILGEGQTDQHALNCLAWVKYKLQYIGDQEHWQMAEYWQRPSESLLAQSGDCEDGAILLYCLMRKNGFSDDQIFITIGDVVGGGHAYVVYVSKEDAVHYALDWCYWKNGSLRVKYGENPNYYFGDKEWCRFNRTGTYVRR